LIGDAAHSCRPVGGQGMNLGIRDAAVLAKVILQASMRGEDIGSEAVLKRYQSWRRIENVVILAFTDFLVRMFSNRSPVAAFARRLGLLALRQWRFLRYLALRLMTGLFGPTRNW